jgi:hypothetical protein
VCGGGGAGESPHERTEVSYGGGRGKETVQEATRFPQAAGSKSSVQQEPICLLGLAGGKRGKGGGARESIIEVIHSVEKTVTG